MRKPVVPLGLAVAFVVSGGAAGQETKAKVADDFVLAEPAPPLPAPVASALQGIRAEALAAHIAFLASPALEGRGLGGRGLEAAAVAVLAAEGEGFAKDLAGEPPARSVFLPFDPEDDALPVVRLSPAAARALLAPAGQSADSGATSICSS